MAPPPRPDVPPSARTRRTDGAAPQRLFLALWPGAGVRRALAACRDGIAWRPGSAPVADDRLHLTLHFIGDVATARVPALRAALRVSTPPFELVLDRAEAWPGGLVVLRPAVVPEPLLALQAALGRALQAAALPVERRAFRPHVTLARRAAGAVPAAPQPGIRWPVAGYVLVRSTLGPPARYEPLWRQTARPAAG